MLEFDWFKIKKELFLFLKIGEKKEIKKNKLKFIRTFDF